MSGFDFSELLEKIRDFFVGIIEKFQSIGFIDSMYTWFVATMADLIGMDIIVSGYILTIGLPVLLLFLLILIIVLACTAKKRKARRRARKEAKAAKNAPVEEKVEAPVVEEPAKEEVKEEIPVEEPQQEEAPAEEKVEETPVEEVKEEPVQEEPAVEEPVAEEPVAEAPQQEEAPAEEKVEEAPVEEVKEEPAQEEPAVEEPAVEEPAVEEPIAEEPKVEEKAEEPKAEEVKEEEPKPAPVKKAAPAKKKPVKESPVVEVIQLGEKPKGVVGKYEVFPVNDVFLYRLKASNGEILVVSEIYKSSKGAVSAIETVKKNIEQGKLEISQDKRGRWQFALFAVNKRLLVASSNYTTKDSCERASESFKRFATNSPIYILGSDEDHLMERIDLDNLLDKPNGKIVITENEGVYEFKLCASNGSVMATSFEFKNKQAVLNGVTSFKEAIKTGQFYVVKDKNDMYQFKLYSTAGRCVVIGETYKNKSQACNAASSVNAFINLCEVVDKA